MTAAGAHRAPAFGVRGLEVRYGRRIALAGVDLEIPAGELTAVVGGDGAGKTTLMRAIVGALRPSAGIVSRPHASQVGYLSARSGVYTDLSVRENLEFAGAAHGIRGMELQRRAAALLERIGLEQAGSRLGRQLSGGMRQKLGFSMAVLHEPALLVLDEPTTGVDPVSRAELWRLIAASAAAGRAVAFSTTYLDEAERGQRILVLDSGHTLATGTPDEVIEAMPGLLLDRAKRGSSPLQWRRGASWREWSPDGSVGPGATMVKPDLQDAVTVLTLAKSLGMPVGASRTAEGRR